MRTKIHKPGKDAASGRPFIQAKQAGGFWPVQTKLAIGKADDPYEREADRMAETVMANDSGQDAFFQPGAQTSAQLKRKNDLPQQVTPLVQRESKDEEDTLQAKREGEALQAKAEEEKEVLKTKDKAESLQLGREEQKKKDLNAGEKLVQKQKELKEKELKAIDGLQKKEDVKRIQRKADGAAVASTAVETSLAASKGGGSALPWETQTAMESGFGRDFSSVRIHTGSEAIRMSRELGAQAFTHGSDIYFNDGKYNPSSNSGKQLLAHELTHTVQQGAAVKPKSIQKTEGEEASQNPDDILRKFYLPAVKARHLQAYQAWASQGKLKRFQGYSRGNPNQVRLWQNYFWDKMQNTEKIGLNEQFSGVKKIQTPGGKEIRGRRASLLKKLTITDWDRQGRVLENTMEVDHIVELQTGGWPNSTTANEIENMELLDKSSNAAAGSKTKSNILAIVRHYLDARGEAHSQTDAENYLESNTINFNQVELGVGDYAGTGGVSQYWTRAEIEQGLHLNPLKDLGNMAEPGSPTEFALMTPDDGYLMCVFPHGDGVLAFVVEAGSTKSKAVAGISISAINLNPGYDALQPNAPMGTLTAAWDLPAEFHAPEGNFQLPINKSAFQYGGKVGNLPPIGLNFQHMSPVELWGEIGISDEGIFAEGRLIPSLEFLRGVELVVGVRGTEVYFNAEFSPSNLNIPIPGLSIDASTIWVGYSSRTGLGVGGNVEFTLSQIASGNVEANFTQATGFGLRGQLTFDEQLFGRTQATATVAYENHLWTIGGTLVIPSDQVRGIKQATIQATYSQEGGFAASGEAELDIPGIERGTMAVVYNDNGFEISGGFNLSPEIPGIRGGNVSATVSKHEGEEAYNVSVTGTAQPDIPGVDSTLTVSYENGAITLEGEAAYERGMLSGTVRLGATNRAIGADGQPTGEPDDTMRVYGGGNLTLQLTPWLAATAGVNFLPNGELEVSGRIGLPSAVNVFERREFNRNLFTVPTVEIPIFAIPLGPRSIGLVAQISGGLGFSAGIGPGQLRNVFAEVTYNPAHEDQTQLHGHGEFAIPADAGLTLRGDMGLGVSVAIASLSGGIELAGTLGLQGEAAAMVDLSWNPESGVTLDAEGRISANPRFVFDVNAFARASLGIGWFSVSETWRHNLAAFSWGPDIQFGVVFPVHYQEGEAFNISVDDIEVIYPDLDVIDMAKDLAIDIKDRIFD